MHPKRHEKNRKVIDNGPRIIGAARNVFGTRLSQRIECCRCHAVDYVSMRIASAKTKYCRSCAERLLETFEAGRAIMPKMVKLICHQCKCEFEVSEAIASKKEDLQCKDCFRGFEVWRGKPSLSSEKKNHSIIVKSGSKTMLRKVLHDPV